MKKAVLAAKQSAQLFSFMELLIVHNLSSG